MCLLLNTNKSKNSQQNRIIAQGQKKELKAWTYLKEKVHENINYDKGGNGHMIW